MTDEMIIELYFARSERAIAETDHSYGAYCRRIALNILNIREDAEECVNDTWLRAWNSIPPERPNSLRAFLASITRNLSISRCRSLGAKKRGGDSLLCELEDSIPSGDTLWERVESNRLARAIGDWLVTLSEDDRALFVRRYYHGDAVSELAALCAVPAAAMAGRLFRLRKSLKKYLEREDFEL